ncbi:porin family protein [Actibacterium sp. 188UL27-1]|uniref:porin family protein n=1 Tax=Actibacterium sp. 188UL27-1 TaxID=2786961 RepID=UPI0019565C48|nr:porin family protein [Actibacterium sp. 188UL27-1]MBM7069690.1 porin family protein [Actibacterium sp. 188UL27-1]
MRASLFILPLAATLAAGPVLAQDLSGFYLGGDLGGFDTEFDGSGDEAEGTAYGVHGGYRYGFSPKLFAEGEVFYSVLDGETDNDAVEFENYYGLSVGLGYYFTPEVYSTAFVGAAQVETDSDANGSSTDDGTIYGVQVGYDLTPVDSLAVRYSRIDVEADDIDDFDTDVFALRYSRRF